MSGVTQLTLMVFSHTVQVIAFSKLKLCLWLLCITRTPFHRYFRLYCYWYQCVGWFLGIQGSTKHCSECAVCVACCTGYAWLGLALHDACPIKFSLPSPYPQHHSRDEIFQALPPIFHVCGVKRSYTIHAKGESLGIRWQAVSRARSQTTWKRWGKHWGSVLCTQFKSENLVSDGYCMLTDSIVKEG